MMSTLPPKKPDRNAHRAADQHRHKRGGKAHHQRDAAAWINSDSMSTPRRRGRAVAVPGAA